MGIDRYVLLATPAATCKVHPGPPDHVPQVEGVDRSQGFAFGYIKALIVAVSAGKLANAVILVRDAA